MNRLLLLPCCFLIAAGCAVTEPTEVDAARVLSAIDVDPGVSIPQLSLELGISELAVVRALPEENARRWQGDPRQAWEEVAGWPVVQLRAENAAFLGRPTDVEIVQESAALTHPHRFRIHVDFTEIEEVWLISQRRDGDVHRGIWWFNGSGDVVMQARVVLVGEGADVVDGLYRKLWESLAPTSSE